MESSRRLAAIMFTDIVGYTALMGVDEERALALLKRNTQIQRPLIESFNGDLLKVMGDGILASFPTVSDAVYCAGAIQNACEAEEHLSLRIGIHQGEVVFEGHDVFGDGVNIASRIEAIAPSDRIWVSESVHKNVLNKKGIETSFVREAQLKNVSEPVRIYEAKVESPVSTPSRVKPPESVKTNRRKVFLGIAGVFAILVLGYFGNSYFRNTLQVNRETIEKSIAVLPFVDMSPEGDQEYLGDGVAEEILNTLAKVEDLKVIARTSSFQFKGENVDVREVGNKLGVGYIVEGSVRKFGDDIRVTAQLINSHDGSHIWSDNFDRPFENLLELQDKISASICDQLYTSLSVNYTSARPTDDIEAYEYYLKGVHIHDHLTFPYENFAVAEKMFFNAIQLDSSFADAHAGLSDLYDSGTWMFPDDSIYIQKAAIEADAAYRLNPKSSYAIIAKALASQRDHKYEQAFELFLTAIEVDHRKDLRAYFALSSLLHDLGQHKEALSVGERMLKFDPLNITTYNWIIFLNTHMGHFGEAIQRIRERSLLTNDGSLFQLFVIACLRKDLSLADKYYDELVSTNTQNDLSDSTDFVKALLLAAKGDLLAIKYSQLIGVRLLLGNESENWDLWFDSYERYLEEVPYRCCGSDIELIYLNHDDPMVDRAFVALMAPIWNHPRFPSLFEKYKNCRDQNAETFSLKNTILRDL